MTEYVGKIEGWSLVVKCQLGCLELFPIGSSSAMLRFHKSIYFKYLSQDLFTRCHTSAGTNALPKSPLTLSGELVASMPSFAIVKFSEEEQMGCSVPKELS